MSVPYLRLKNGRNCVVLFQRKNLRIEDNSSCNAYFCGFEAKKLRSDSSSNHKTDINKDISFS